MCAIITLTHDPLKLSFSSSVNLLCRYGIGLLTTLLFVFTLCSCEAKDSDDNAPAEFMREDGRVVCCFTCESDWYYY